MDKPPIPNWKRLFDRLEPTVGNRLDHLVRSEDFATVVAILKRAQRRMQEHGERNSRRLLHVLNLPAGSDVNRLLTQIAKLEREVRNLRKQLGDTSEEVSGVAPAPGSHSPARTASA